MVSIEKLQNGGFYKYIDEDGVTAVVKLLPFKFLSGKDDPKTRFRIKVIKYLSYGTLDLKNNKLAPLNSFRNVSFNKDHVKEVEEHFHELTETENILFG